MMKKHVVLDGLLFIDPTRSIGIQRIWENILPYILKDHDVTFLIRKQTPQKALVSIPYNKFHTISSSPTPEYLGQIYKRLSGDVFISTHYSWASGARNYTFVHDMINELLSPGNAFRSIKVKSIQHCEKFWCISEQTKRHLMEIVGVPEHLISVIYCGLNLDMFPETPSNIAFIKRKFSITKPYFIIIGTRSPHKNRKNMVAAFAPFKDTHNLVIVEPQDIFSVKDGIITIPRNLSNTEIRILLSGAECLLHVSFIEGFGIPILEAQACGTPVVTSDRSCLPEIVHESALMVSPDNISDISAAIQIAIDNTSILVQRGFANIKRFSWEDAGKAVSASIGE